MKFVLDVKEQRLYCLIIRSGWDSLREKCVVADCKLESTNYRELTVNYQNRLIQVGCDAC